jgi:acyl carrier protein
VAVVDTRTAIDWLKSLLIDVLEIDAEQVGVESLFYDDLELDSLQKIDFFTRVERRFGMKLDPGDAVAMRSIADTVTVLHGKGAIVDG